MQALAWLRKAYNCEIPLKTPNLHQQEATCESSIYQGGHAAHTTIRVQYQRKYHIPTWWREMNITQSSYSLI